MNNTKKLIKFKARKGFLEEIIEEDLPNVGYYLYIIENGKEKYDYLQDTVDICKEQAFEDFGIPLDTWVEVTED